MKLAYKFALTVVLSAVFVVSSWAADNGPVVKVEGGQISGAVLSGGVVTFKGIPFAAPPVGPLRWRPPQSVVAWKGVRETTAFAPACTQNWSPGGAFAGGSKINGEDCLYLNVWTSEWPSKSPKAVMVWPSYTNSAAEPFLDGAALSRRGVIVVTLNSRRGVFGYFAHPELTAESPHHSSGNYGYLDIIAGLQWVHDNISKFGGDPARVTIFGQAEGASAIAYLLTSPLMKGLATRAIQESEGIGGPEHGYDEGTPLSKAEAQGVKFADSLLVVPMGKDVVKAPADTDPIEFLRSIPGPALLTLAGEAAAKGNGPNTLEIVDGWVIPGKPVEAYEHEQELPIPLLLGNNSQEHHGPAPDRYCAHGCPPDMVKKAVDSTFGSFASQAEAYYGIASGGAGNTDPVYGNIAAQIEADAENRCGSIVEANWHVAHVQPVYEYQFDHAIPGRGVVDHNTEQGYVFGNLTTIGWLGGGPYTEVDHKISDEMGNYWTNFAKNADPNGPGLPNWPKWDAATRPYIEFTDNGPVPGKDLRRGICDLYMDHLKKDLSLQLP